MPTVICNYCNKAGNVEVTGKGKGRTIEVLDEIEHADNCKLHLSRTRKSRQPRHLAKKRWQRQETRAAALLNAHETPASGSLGEDGDARSIHGVRVECKQSETGVYRLSQRVWSKLVNGARASGEIPVLQVETRSNGQVTTLYAVPHGTLNVDSQPYDIPGAKSRVPFNDEIISRTPFHSDILDPPLVVLTETEIKEALHDALGG